MKDYINDLRSQTAAAEDFFAAKVAFTVGPVELKKMLNDNKVILIDVREEADYKKGHIPNAVSIPKNQLGEYLTDLSRNNLHVVYCYNPYCHLAAKAALFLSRNGFSVIELCGGYDVWVNSFNYDIEAG